MSFPIMDLDRRAHELGRREDGDGIGEGKGGFLIVLYNAGARMAGKERAVHTGRLTRAPLVCNQRLRCYPHFVNEQLYKAQTNPVRAVKMARLRERKVRRRKQCISNNETTALRRIFRDRKGLELRESIVRVAIGAGRSCCTVSNAGASGEQHDNNRQQG